MKIELLWKAAVDDVKLHPLSDGDLKLLRADVAGPIDLYGGVDSAGRLLLGAAIDVAPPQIDLESGALEYIRRKKAAGGWWMALRLSNTSLLPVFATMCEGLLNEVPRLANQESAIELLKKRLLQWVKLFDEGRSGLLDQSRVRGLVGELAVLLVLIRKHGPDAAVSAWTGPLRRDQDFMFSHVAYEVKTVSEQSDSIRISSLTQLLADRPIELCVIVLRSFGAPEREPLSLNGYVAEVESALSESSEALTEFRDKLLEAGYVERTEYASTFHEVLGWRTFQVRGSFPRLAPDSVPPGVVAATYAVALSAMLPYEVAGGLRD